MTDLGLRLLCALGLLAGLGVLLLWWLGSFKR